MFGNNIFLLMLLMFFTWTSWIVAVLGVLLCNFILLIEKKNYKDIRNWNGLRLQKCRVQPKFKLSPKTLLEREKERG
jgi:hypothetical protein